MFVRCQACRGAKQVNGLGSMGMVNCKACKGTGKVKEEFDIDLPCTNKTSLLDRKGLIVNSEFEPENLGLGSEDEGAFIADSPETRKILASVQQASMPVKPVEKFIKEVATHGKKKK